ncbi:PDC sensor domain-containing protein, partial [Treponema sp. R6D11]
IDTPNGIAETVPYIDIVTDEIVLTYSRCIYNNDGSRLGVVAIDVRAGRIGEKIVDTASEKGNSYGVLISQDLTIIGHSNKDYLGKKMSDPTIPLSALADELVSKGKLSEVSWV